VKHFAKTSSEQSTRFKKSEYLSWAERFSHAIDIVIGTLETLIKRWTVFCDHSGPSYFNEADMRGLLQGIEASFTYMDEDLLGDLYQLKKACDSHTSYVRRFPDLHEFGLNWLILILTQIVEEPAEPAADGEL
jgi:hypothetical protein